ncbi:MAG: hypothetical protein D6730_04340 [Bacteroidetes bacterium]|nr:MAG: hypothetical protein D6730_04340 [Bacteroidota bacterium]
MLQDMNSFRLNMLLFAQLLLACACHTGGSGEGASPAANEVVFTTPLPGYRGIWYSNQPSNDSLVYKYSGGLGTYPAKHNPFAIYRKEVNKTFFCYGGADFSNPQNLIHCVAFFDHEQGEVPQPFALLNKQTADAHDNPVMSIDREGYIWVFSTSHGTSRPSFIHKSTKPYQLSAFERIAAVREENGEIRPLDNFSYLQVWHDSTQFLAFFTWYKQDTSMLGRNRRTLNFMRSTDGIHWRDVQMLAAAEEGHYQISTLRQGKLGTAFNVHPHISEEIRGLNLRTNLYFLQTTDAGKSWQNAAGKDIALPLTTLNNEALVRDYQQQGLLVYLKDMQFDSRGHPVLLYLTARGYEAGPQNDPRKWNIAKWTGEKWAFFEITTSDNNYDMGSLYLESDSLWRILAPTARGPQAYNPGGEVEIWESRDTGQHWQKAMQITANSEFNHTYVRRPVHAHPGFYAFWADGHGRKPSESRLYFANKNGQVFRLPYHMPQSHARPPQLFLP